MSDTQPFVAVRDNKNRTDQMVELAANNAFKQVEDGARQLIEYYCNAIRQSTLSTVSGGSLVTFTDKNKNKIICPSLTLDDSDKIPQKEFTGERTILYSSINLVRDYLLFIARCHYNERGIEIDVKVANTLTWPYSNYCYISVVVVNTNIIFEQQYVMTRNSINPLMSVEEHAKLAKNKSGSATIAAFERMTRPTQVIPANPETGAAARKMELYTKTGKPVNVYHMPKDKMSALPLSPFSVNSTVQHITAEKNSNVATTGMVSDVDLRAKLVSINNEKTGVPSVVQKANIPSSQIPPVEKNASSPFNTDNNITSPPSQNGSKHMLPPLTAPVAAANAAANEEHAPPPPPSPPVSNPPSPKSSPKPIPREPTIEQDVTDTSDVSSSIKTHESSK